MRVRATPTGGPGSSGGVSEAGSEGLEGEDPVRADPDDIRGAYTRAFDAHIAAVRREATAFGFDHDVVSPHDWLGPPLAAFIARRQSLMRRSRIG